ncbi:MAG: glycosyltransferase family 39 protein, partial [Anaerolineae bacterium]|nr:glycosyltransferase family 39 protein [Anaerolineae bacterium]
MRRGWHLVVLLLLAAALRLHRLEVQSFWNDEGNSARLSERSVALIVEGAASDVHPPLYYLALRGWRELAGETEFGLRAFSAFAGILTVALTAALARRWWRSPAGVGAATLFAAVNPALIYYSQEARMYALLALLAVLSTLLLLALLRAQSARQALLALLYLVSVVAGLYTHYFFPAVLVVHGLTVLASFWPRRWRVLLGWVGLMVLALALYAPWLPIFLRQTGGRVGGETGVLAFLGEAARWLVLGPTAGDWGRWVVVAVAIAAVVPLMAIASSPPNAGRRWRAGLALAAVLLPVILMWLVQATRPAFYKFMVVAVPFLALLWGRGIGSLMLGAASRRAPAAALGLALVAFQLAGSGQALANLYYVPAFARADYRSMAARIAAENHPNAGVIINAANQWEVFTYYHRDGAPVYPIPRGAPDAAMIAAELEEIAAEHDRLYAIFWGEAERDPERLVERWLDAHAFKATDEWVGDVRFVVYAVPPEPALAMETAADVQFGEAITLRGYTLRGEEVEAGDVIQVTLFWETALPLQERYKVFLHLAGESGVPVAQRDSEPGGGLALTTTWSPGETVIDNHGVFVPPETPSGSYRLLVGLYDLTDPARRLPLPSG